MTTNKMVAVHMLLMNYFLLGLTSNRPHLHQVLTEHEMAVLLSCSAGCSACSAVNGCLSCRAPYFLSLRREGARQLASCHKSCPAGFYKTRDLEKRFCISCHLHGCLECSSGRYCDRCSPPLQLYRGRCRGACPTGTLPHRNTCVRKRKRLPHASSGSHDDLWLGNVTSNLIEDATPDRHHSSLKFDKKKMQDFSSPKSRRDRKQKEDYLQNIWREFNNKRLGGFNKTIWSGLAETVRENPNTTSFGRMSYYSSGPTINDSSAQQEVYGVMVHSPEENSLFHDRIAKNQRQAAWKLIRRRGRVKRRHGKRRRRRRRNRMRNKKRKFSKRLIDLEPRMNISEMEENMIQMEQGRKSRRKILRKRRKGRRRQRIKNQTRNEVT
ncbi:uncharacterized protein LOC108671282 isoform X3 [Hyalella azteca]|uniref:Uncharacterized protein LOC108671282 isoform X3 n=1 Tax=Hyalella azteca TaxID=294128 RepID=A0A8B7NKT6_HYAAZ|nr:uncharacterized protein LOC108671282 isoform X3 [Hyalella azteca]